MRMMKVNHTSNRIKVKNKTWSGPGKIKQRSNSRILVARIDHSSEHILQLIIIQAN